MFWMGCCNTFKVLWNILNSVDHSSRCYDVEYFIRSINWNYLRRYISLYSLWTFCCKPTDVVMIVHCRLIGHWLIHVNCIEFHAQHDVALTIFTSTVHLLFWIYFQQNICNLHSMSIPSVKPTIFNICFNFDVLGIVGPLLFILLLIILGFTV